MTTGEILRLRLANQQLSRHEFKTPGQIVSWLGAVQAQDYLNSKWAIGLRLKNSTDADIEQAITDKKIVRTWPMRRTLHFVTPQDIHWMLELLTPRVIARCATMYKQIGLDDNTFLKSKIILTRLLRDQKQLTRNEIYHALEKAKVSTTNQRGLHILTHHAQNGLICFAARNGKQQTFALLEEWTPLSKKLKRDEALAELTKRYFIGHGPATIHDFAWWSGLTIADIKAGLEMVKSHLQNEVIDEQVYWMSQDALGAKTNSPVVCLLPYYDEYLVSYKNRTAAVDRKYRKLIGTANGIFNPVIIINGKVAGTWKRAFEKDKVKIEIKIATPLSKLQKHLVVAAAERYSTFLKMPAIFSFK
jgi:hypothetical protein